MAWRDSKVAADGDEQFPSGKPQTGKSARKINYRFRRNRIIQMSSRLPAETLTSSRAS